VALRSLESLAPTAEPRRSTRRRAVMLLSAFVAPSGLACAHEGEVDRTFE
jgi:hypothetical protein